MKLLLTLTIQILIFKSLNAQLQFQKTIGGENYDYSTSSIITSDNNVVLAGKTSTFTSGGSDIYLVKSDLEGNVVWTKSFGDTDNQEANCVIETSDGGYVVLGSSYNFNINHSDFYLLKVNSNGELLWSKTFGGSGYEFGYSVNETIDGGLIISGVNGSCAVEYEIYLIKTDENGNEEWSESFGGLNSEYGFSVIEDGLGGYYVTGVTMSYGTSLASVILIKTNSFGNPIWTKIYGGNDITQWERANFLIKTNDNNLMLIGKTTSFGAGESDILLIKVDLEGNLIWSKTYGNEFYDEGRSIIELDNGNFLLTGMISRQMDIFTIYTDLCAIEINQMGEILWSKIIGNDMNDSGYNCHTLNDGYLFTGTSDNPVTGYSDVFLVKTDLSGNLFCNSLEAEILETSPILSQAEVNIPITFFEFIESEILDSTNQGGEVTSICSNLNLNKLENQAIDIYPNPAENAVSVSFKNMISNSKIEFFDSKGILVYEIKDYSGDFISIERGNLKSGLYLLSVENNEMNEICKIIFE